MKQHRIGSAVRIVARATLMCGLLGVVTTIAVAWLLAMFAPRASARLTHVSEVREVDSAGRKALFMLTRADRAGFVGLYSDTPMHDQHGEFLVEPSRAFGVAIPGWATSVLERYWLSHERHMLQLEAFGWPMPAARSTSRIATDYLGKVYFADHEGIVVWRIMHQSPVLKYTMPVVLPLRPLWRGLAVNSVVFAAVWLVPVYMAGAVRRRVRVRRGRCPRCGYDLRGQQEAGCPECGWGRDAAV